VTLAVAAAGLIGTVAAPDATVTGPPAPRLVPEFVTTTLALPPLHAAGIAVRRTAVTVLLEIVKFVTTPARLAHDVTVTEPATRVLLDGANGRA